MTLFALTLIVVGVGAVVWKMLRSTGSGTSSTTLKLAPLALVAFGLQLVALNWAGGVARVGLYALSQGMLIVFFAINLDCKPMRLLAIGFLLNFIPIVLNGGYMPITPEAMVGLHPGTQMAQWSIGLVRPGSKDIVVAAMASPFWFLGDVFVLSKPFPLPTAFSWGDLVILAGFGATMYYLTPSIGVGYVTAHRSGTFDQRGRSRPAV